MKTGKLLSAAMLATGHILSASDVHAQGIGGIPFAQIDINGDGSLDAAELLAAFDAAGLSILSRDLSGDGLVSREELQTSRQYSKEDGTTGADSVASLDDASQRNLVNNPAGTSNPGLGASPSADDGNQGHGNDVDGTDESNPGRGHGNGANGAGRGHGDRGRS